VIAQAAPSTDGVASRIRRKTIMDHSLASRTVAAPRTRNGGIVAAIAARLVAAWRDWQRQRDREAVRRTLDSLSDATLRDLGFSRGELGSVAAELVGEAETTRRRTTPTAQRIRP
jgi:uncharacterized protein YjiS (DUF1127 family)